MALSIASLSLLGSLTSAATLAKAPVVVSVNPGITYQEVDGFGISEAFGHAAIIQGLPGNDSSAILDFLFSNEGEGAGLTIIRNEIIPSEVEPNDPGSPKATPQYVWDYNDDVQVYVTQQAMARGLTTVYADAWTAPGFMKTNNNENDGGYLCGVSGTNCTYDWRTAYSHYLIQYIRDYHEAGINIDYIGWINEPEENVTYTSMLLENGQQAADFINVFAPILKNSGLSTQQACCDGAGWEFQRFLLEGIQAGGAEKHLGIVTSHGYITPPSTPFNTTKKVWETEWADLSTQGQQPWYLNGGTAEALTWANHIQSGFVNSNLSAFLGWVGTTGSFLSNDAFIEVVGDAWMVNPRLFAFAQYSRFVKPGAHRIAASTALSTLAVSAFSNKDGSVAVQVINNSDQQEKVVVEGVFAPKGKKSIMTYLSNNANNLTAIKASADGTLGFEANVPARSLVSFVVPTQ